MRLALIVDNPFRDLPGSVLLAIRLAEKGAECFLVPLNLASREVSALAPDFVLLTSLRRPRQRFARQLLDAGIRLGVLEAEGGVVPSLDMYTRLTNPDPALYEEITSFCSWGPKVGSFVVEERWYSSNQVTVTGSPRFDFYASNWREAALRIAPLFSAVDGPIILINGSFPRANPGIVSREREQQSWIANGFDPTFVKKHQEVEYQTMLGMAELANHLATRFPKATVIYRPHPFEKLETYYELLGKYPNLKLIKEGTIEGWILRASVIIQHHCTTAIEAGMAGKPALLPNWLPTAQRIESTELASISINSQDEMDELIDGALSGTVDTKSLVPASLESVINEWFFKIDGHAHDRVATTLLSKLSDTSASVNLSKCRRIHYSWGEPDRTLAARVGASFRMGLGLPISWSNRQLRDVEEWHDWWDQSPKHFNVLGVRSLVNQLRTEDTEFQVEQCREKLDYRLNYTKGRSVRIVKAT